MGNRIGTGTEEEQTALGRLGGKASGLARREKAGKHVHKVRKIGLEILDMEEFKQQLLNEIFEQNKAIKFLQVLAKYNPAGEVSDGGGGGRGNILININSPVDRSVPAVEIKQTGGDDGEGGLGEEEWEEEEGKTEENEDET